METLPALLSELPRLFTLLDLVALGVFLASTLLMTLLIERKAARRQSVSRLMEGYRRAWMDTFSRREGRIFDAALLTTLRNGAAFFGSTCLIAIGGIAAAIGQTERIIGVARDLGAQATEPTWEAKLLVVLILLVNAFLKFVWSHRLFGYCAVMMGAMPEGAEEAERKAAVERAARLQMSAGRSFNRGLRALYFAIAALAWFLGPLPLIVASLLTAAMLYRREFLSESRRTLVGPGSH